MEEYLTIKELSKRIKYSEQTIYNYIHNKIFILGIHYLKPTPKKILFRWSAIREWMGESSTNGNCEGQPLFESSSDITDISIVDRKNIKKLDKNLSYSLPFPPDSC